jgi:uncharacterized protein YfkK (UPF0435 family)
MTTSFEFSEQELNLLEYGLGLIVNRIEEGTLKPKDIKGATYQDMVDLYAKIVRRRQGGEEAGEDIAKK